MIQNSPCSRSWNRSPNTWSAMEKRLNSTMEARMARKNHRSVTAASPLRKLIKAARYKPKFRASSPDTNARAAVANRGSFNPREAKNLMNRAKKSLPTQRCWTSGMILSVTLRPQKRVQNTRMAKRRRRRSVMACPR